MQRLFLIIFSMLTTLFIFNNADAGVDTGTRGSCPAYVVCTGDTKQSCQIAPSAFSSYFFVEKIATSGVIPGPFPLISAHRIDQGDRIECKYQTFPVVKALWIKMHGNYFAEPDYSRGSWTHARDSGCSASADDPGRCSFFIKNKGN